MRSSRPTELVSLTSGIPALTGFSDLGLMKPSGVHSISSFLMVSARHWAAFNRVMETGVCRYYRGNLLSVPALTRSGQRISVEFTIALLKDEQDHPIGTLTISRDVTTQFEESRKLKRQLAEITGSR